jgi:hypothetical protein
MHIVFEASLGLPGHFAMLAVAGAPAEALERRYRPGAAEFAAMAVGQLRPLRHRVYSELHGGRIESPQEAWRPLVEHLFLCQRFDRAFQAAGDHGVACWLELGPAGTLERAVCRLDRCEVEVATVPASPVRVGPGRKMRC